MQERYSKFLPSKKFTLILIACIVLGILIFVIFFMSSGGKNFTLNKEPSKLKVENQNVVDLIQKDTDGDGVPDWEEALWGTDKNKKITFGDTPDATYIENKKRDLKVEESTSVQKQNMTETEKFAREFFASYAAMKSSGEVNTDTINSFSNALGQKIINPDLVDKYKESDVKISQDDTLINRQKYYVTMKSIFDKYKVSGLGDELSVITENSQVSEEEQYTKLTSISNAYENFASDIMKLGVPISLESYHLRIANSANNTGISVLNMQKIITDPIVGLSGLSEYQKYSDDLIKAVSDLEANLLK